MRACAAALQSFSASGAAYALPANVVARIEQTSPAECEALALRLLTAGSLAELGL